MCVNDDAGMGILDLNRPEVAKALGELERLSLLADGSEAQVGQT